MTPGLAPRSSTPHPEPLWRELVGAELRRRRHDRDETLAQVAHRAGISTQYLSEIERGVKEPSSEVLSAVVGALELGLLDLTTAVSFRLGSRPLLVTSSAVRTSTLSGPLALAA